jgi:hypothetical protein
LYGAANTTITEISPRQCKDALIRYRDNLPKFYVEHLGMQEDYIWNGMRQIADSVRDYQKTCVYSGHSLSKDYGCARLALAYLYTHGPRCSVIVTGPSNNQVENIFFREVGDAFNSAPFPLEGKCLTTKIEIDKKWFMLGFTTDIDETGEATRFQGWHNEEVLIIFTEAAGVPHYIWRAVDHLIINKKHKLLVYGNATSATGDFAQCIKDPTFHCINLSVLESPNYVLGKDVIPGVSGRDYEQSIRLKFGVNSDEYRVRVLGLISNKKAEGAYYSESMQYLHQQYKITNVKPEIDRLVFGVIDPGYTTALGLCQPFGTDVRIFRYYEDQGMGIDGYGKLMREWEKQYKYIYGGIFVPCDMDNNAHRVTHGDTSLEVLQGLGFNCIPLPRETNVISDGIPRTQRFLKRCLIDKDDCSVLIECLENYHEKINNRMSTEEKKVYRGVPDKDGYDHGADMVRYMSMAFEKGMVPITPGNCGNSNACVPSGRF